MLMYKTHYFEDKIFEKEVIFEKLLLNKNLIYRFLVNEQQAFLSFWWTL